MLMPIQENTSTKTMYKRRNHYNNNSTIQLKKKITARRLPLMTKTRSMATAMAEAKVVMVIDKIV